MSYTSTVDTVASASTPRRLVPPRPQVAPETMTMPQRIRKLRINVLESWGQRAYEEDVITGHFLGRHSFILNDPDGIRHVLIDNYENYTRTPAGFRVLRPMLGEGLLLAEGKTWKHQRRTLAPAFTPRAVNTLIPHIVSAIDDTVAALRKTCGRDVDLQEAMQHMALEIAGRTMFSFDMTTQGAPLRAFVIEYGTTLARPHFLDLVLPRGWPTPKDFARARFRRRWMRFIQGMIAERRAIAVSSDAPRDLFELMVTARDPETGAAFSDIHLADQVATMILAGHETTATALFWALYVLALDPAIQDRIADEVKAAGTNPAVEQLLYTRAVLDETLRLYPPAYLIARAAYGKDTICGHAVGRNDVVFIAPWLLHRHRKLWDDPDAFRPERFLPGAPPPPRFAYLPFGVGPRVCIGAHFALTEATLALARIVNAFRIAVDQSQRVIPVGIVTTQPDKKPPFVLTPR